MSGKETGRVNLFIEREKEKEKKKKRGSFLRTLATILAGFFIGIYIFRYILLMGVIPSTSMLPTYKVGDKVVTNRFQKDLSNGNTVVFRFEQEGQNTLMIKRVIGVGGDEILIQDGEVYVNGKRIVENYTEGKTYAINNKSKFLVPEDHYFLLGDNRENSYDSRSWTEPYIHKKYVEGKAIFKLPSIKTADNNE